MASWRESLFQLVLAIIGSSLFGLALSNLYSILSQPSIDIQVKETKSYYSLNNNILTTTITNLGRTAANDIRLTMAFNSSLMNYTIFTTENITSKQEIKPVQKLPIPSSIIINIRRLSPNSIMVVNTETDAPPSKDLYFISATYGQNTIIRTNAANATNFLSNTRSNGNFELYNNPTDFNEILLIASSILSFGSFLALAMRRRKTVLQKYDYTKNSTTFDSK
jgi:hypothetical protein